MELNRDLPMATPQAKPFSIDYFVAESHLIDLENAIVERAHQLEGKTGIKVLLLSPLHPFSNFVRSQEEKSFPGASSQLSFEAELDTQQLVIVDLRRRSSSYKKITFVGTLSGFRIPEAAIGSTGILAVDELISIPENGISAEEFRVWCQMKGVNPQKIIGVETGIKLINGVKSFRRLRTTQIAYLAVMQIAENLEADNSTNSTGVGAIARANRGALRSTNRYGIRCDPLLDRSDLETPESMGSEPYETVLFSKKKSRRFALFKYVAPKVHILNDFR